MGNKKTKRFSSVDGFRAIAAFMVVFLHSQFKSPAEDYILVLSRIAVPFFFLVSGFFIYNMDWQKQQSRTKKQIVSIFKLTILANLLYLIYNLFDIKFVQGTLQGLIDDIFSYKFILFNLNFAGHLWFLRAMLYVLILFYFISKFKLEKLSYIAAILILILDTLMIKYSFLFGIEVPRRFYEPFEKFIGVGFVYFILGHFIRKLYESGIIHKIHRNVYLTLFIVSMFGTMFEYHYLELNLLNKPACNFIGTAFTVILLMLYLIEKPALFEDTTIEKMGNKYSSHIYIVHIIVRAYLPYIFRGLGIRLIYPYISTFAIYFVSLFVAMLYIKVKKTIFIKG